MDYLLKIPICDADIGAQPTISQTFEAISFPDLYNPDRLLQMFTDRFTSNKFMCIYTTISPFLMLNSIQLPEPLPICSTLTFYPSVLWLLP